MDTVIDHHIQRDIIDRLMHSERLRFSELKPDGMESNIFMYHVAQLKKLHYIDKDEAGYFLAHAGLQYVDGIRGDKQKPTRQPKLIAIIILQNKDGQYLMAERKNQPYINQLMFMSGKQHFGETIGEQSIRELSEKGINDTPLTYRGIADIEISSDSGPLTHVIAHVHYGEYNGPLPTETTDFCFTWHDFSNKNVKLMPGTAELQSELKQTTPFACTIRTKT